MVEQGERALLPLLGNGMSRIEEARSLRAPAEGRSLRRDGTLPIPETPGRHARMVGMRTPRSSAVGLSGAEPDESVPGRSEGLHAGRDYLGADEALHGMNPADLSAEPAHV